MQINVVLDVVLTLKRIKGHESRSKSKTNCDSLPDAFFCFMPAKCNTLSYNKFDELRLHLL